jgi:hypothetical protein
VHLNVKTLFERLPYCWNAMHELCQVVGLFRFVNLTAQFLSFQFIRAFYFCVSFNSAVPSFHLAHPLNS